MSHGHSQTNSAPDCSRLLRELEHERKINIHWAKFYDDTTDVLTMISLLSGFLVTILLLGNVRPTVAAALSSAIPGAALAIVKGLRMTDRGQWHWARAARFYVLENKLRYENKSLDAVARDFDVELRKHDFPKRYTVEQVMALVSSRE